MAVSISRGERIFNGCNVVFMVLLSAWFIIPFVVVASTSVVGAAEAARRGGLVLIPQTFDLGAYQAIFAKGSAIIRSYGVTLFRVVVGTALNLLFTAPFAYALSKRSVPGRTPITMFVFFTILFHGGLIPTYLVVRYTGLYNTLWALVIPQLVNPFWMLIMRNFFFTIPESLEESALIDGATPPMVLWKVVLPLSLPVMTTIGLFYAVWHWNSWFDAAIYIADIRRMPVQIILRRILINATEVINDNPEMLYEMDAPPPPDAIKGAVIMVATVPILFVYPFIQKYFVKGVLLGSVKG